MNNSTSFSPERAAVIQPFGSLRPVRLGLDEDARHRSVAALNRLSPYAQSVLDRLLPVPPALAPYPPCRKLPP